MIPSLLVGSALLLLFSPWMLSIGIRLLSGELTRSPQPLASVTYQNAMADLASVRRRLLDTNTLDDKVKAAIDTLTLALVAGSDK